MLKVKNLLLGNTWDIFHIRISSSAKASDVRTIYDVSKTPILIVSKAYKAASPFPVHSIFMFASPLLGRKILSLEHLVRTVVEKHFKKFCERRL